MLISSVTCAEVISLFATRLNVKKSEKMMKIVNIDEENLLIFHTIWGISMKFSGKMCLQE